MRPRHEAQHSRRGTRGLAALASALLLVACATAPPAAEGPDAELRRLSDLLVGDYFSPRDAGVREDRPIYLRIRRVAPPPGARIALYAEMRHDHAQGELYRQRLYLFDETPGRTSNTMRALSFADGAAAARLVDDPDLLQRAALLTTDPLGAGCLTSWRADGAAFVGRVDPARCEVTGKRGDRRRIESITRITAESIGQLERGFDPQGRRLFGNAGDSLMVWPRVPPSR
jgi:hypothetical protein